MLNLNIVTTHVHNVVNTNVSSSETRPPPYATPYPRKDNSFSANTYLGYTAYPSFSPSLLETFDILLPTLIYVSGDWSFIMQSVMVLPPIKISLYNYSIILNI